MRQLNWYNWILIWIFVILFYADALAQEGGFDFRRTRWGMTKVQVGAAETSGPLEERDNSLAYKGTAVGRKVRISYYFVGDRLDRAEYDFLAKYSDEDSYIRDYQTIKKDVTYKYGSPSSDKVLSRPSRFKDDALEAALAISTGRIMYFSLWKTKRTTISLMLAGLNSKIVHSLTYRDRTLELLLEKARQKGIHSDL